MGFSNTIVPLHNMLLEAFCLSNSIRTPPVQFFGFFMLQNDFFVQLPKALKSSKDGSMDVENIAIDVTGDANGFL